MTKNYMSQDSIPRLQTPFQSTVTLDDAPNPYIFTKLFQDPESPNFQVVIVRLPGNPPKNQI